MKPPNQINKVIELGVMSTDPVMKPFQQAVIALAQQQARIKVKAALTATTIAALTDNGGGTASAATPPEVKAGVMPTATVMDGVALYAPKAGFDTAVAALYAAQQELGAKITSLKPFIDPTRDVSVFAGTNDGTIAAITVALTGVADTTGVAAASALTQLMRLRNNFAALTAATNYQRVAVGLAPIADLTGGALDMTDPAVWPGVATASTASAVTTGAASLPEVATETILGVFRDNVKTLSTAINQIINVNDANLGPFVVATDRARTKFRAADITP